ncbi:uncharacterized protein [Nicotiana tomentosiformis]|uniref:uncharacterized protein n=1 Tax=Nicotiana tomentosiformis TaxID=4098 RepID=UPI00388CD12C
MVAQGPKSPLTYQTPLPIFQPSHPKYQYLVATYHTYNNQPAYYHSPPPADQNYPKPRPNFDCIPPRQYTPIAEPIAQLYERLKAAAYVTPIPAVVLENPSQWVNLKKTHAYHSGMKGHTIKECRTLKYKIHTLIYTKVIQANKAGPNVHNNPLPNHRGKGVNVIETDEEWDQEGSIRLIREGDTPKTSMATLTPVVVQNQAPFEVEIATHFTVMVSPTPSYGLVAIPWDYVAEARRKGKAKMEETSVAQGITRTSRVYTLENLGGTSKETEPKSPVVETDTDDLWRKIQAREYSIVDHLNKTPAQISILSLLQNSDTHKNDLMKVLSEAYVPAGITSGEIANMVEQILESHKINFHKDELPPEGLSHNRELHIIVKF